MKLSATQEALMRDLEEKDLLWRQEKVVARQNAIRAAEISIEQAAYERKMAVLRANLGGVPKVQIHTRGMHTKRPNELYEILNSNSELIEVIGEQAAKNAGPFTWTDATHTSVDIELPDYYDTEDDAPQGYVWIDFSTTPPTRRNTLKTLDLAGTAIRNEFGWKLTRDEQQSDNAPGMVRNGFPFLSGPLAFELEAGPVRDQLDEWGEANR